MSRNYITPLAEITRILRVQQHETMADMAKKLGVSGSFLSMVENGKKEAPITWAKKITELYKCDYIDLERAIEESKISTPLTLETPIQVKGGPLLPLLDIGLS